MISCTYSLPLHEELNFSRPLGILKSEKKMIGHKILLNSMRASSLWDAGRRENAQRAFIYIRCRISCKIWLIRFWQLNTQRGLGTRQVNTAILSHFWVFCLGLTFSLGQSYPRNALAARNNGREARQARRSISTKSTFDHLRYVDKIGRFDGIIADCDSELLDVTAAVSYSGP